jgi:hypothetical protein
MGRFAFLPNIVKLLLVFPLLKKFEGCESFFGIYVRFSMFSEFEQIGVAVAIMILAYATLDILYHLIAVMKEL